MHSTEAGWVRLLLTTAGAAAVGVGLMAIAFGSVWASDALDLVASNPIGGALELLVPFLPIFLIGSGALLLVKGRR